MTDRDERIDAFWEPAGSLEPKMPATRAEEPAAAEGPADITGHEMPAEPAGPETPAAHTEYTEPEETYTDTAETYAEPAEEKKYAPMFDDDDPMLEGASGYAARTEGQHEQPERPEPSAEGPVKEEPAHTAGASATGNGSYRYSSGREYYDSADRGGYAYSGGAGSLRYSDDSSDHEKRHGRKGKAVFAVLLAVIFGLCTGAGAWGAGTLMKSSAAVEKAAEEPGKDAGQEEQDEADTGTEKEREEDGQETAAAPGADPQFVTGSGENPSTDISEVAESVMPSIVSVYNSYIAESYYFGQSYKQEAMSTGSGIIIATTDSELLIATNNHVVENAESLSVRFIDDAEVEANVKGTDATHDLAVIAVSRDAIDEATYDQISVATLGSSETLKVGQAAVAIGNALGYGQSVTSGIVSAVNRQITSEDGITGTFIQTDAAINPGNSGGALVNMNGEVIGINSSKIGGSTVEGMGFAIPISDAQPIIEELMKQETRRKVADGEQGTLGISGATVTAEAQQFYNMPSGIYVAETLEGGAAQSSGLQKGDIIMEINGTSVTSMESLKKQLTYYEAGTSVQLTVARQGEDGSYEQTEMTVTLGTQDVLTTQEKQDDTQEDDIQSSWREEQRPDTGRGFRQEDGNWLFDWPFGSFDEGGDEEGDR